MEKRDYYDVLGVGRDADGSALKSAFRKLAMKFHPDRNPDNPSAEQSFKEINEAYDALKNPDKRAAYDRFGHAAFEGGGNPGAGFGNDFASSMSDIFDDFFGMGRQRAGGGRERGTDLRYNLEVELTDAFEGKTVDIQVPTTVTCEVCTGSGATPGTSPSTCTTCAGQGRVRSSQGFFTMERTCPHCAGRGEIITDPCTSCSGSGRTSKERSLSVNIPAGIEDGTRIRLSGEGEAGVLGGPSGDLYIFLSIRPHEFFQRDGADLFCRVPISMTTAALGGQLEVPTVSGEKTRVKVPAGTQTGKQFRLKSKGMPVLRAHQTGDMYIQVAVETPRSLSKRQRELLEEFEQASNAETHPDSAGFFTKVRDFLDNLGN